MTAAKLADTSDPRFTDDQRASVARFDAAPTPPEVVDAVVAEIASRYRDPAAARFAINDFRDWLDDHPAAVAGYRAAQDGGEHGPSRCVSVEDANRVLAEARAAAEHFAAATQDGGAEEAVRRVEALAEEYDANLNWREWGVGSRIRAALAPQAER